MARRVAIPTESQRPEGLPFLDTYLREEMIPAFEAMGFECKRYENPFEGAGPFLLAHRHESDDCPTVLGYGHGDVIQGLDDLWTKGEGPWVTARDGDRLYGRGTADNKGQHTINMAAMNAVLSERGSLGFNAKVLIEMGEENSSKGLREVVQDNLQDFSADVFIGSDGPRVDPERPSVLSGQPRYDQLRSCLRVSGRRASFRQLGRAAGEPFGGPVSCHLLHSVSHGRDQDQRVAAAADQELGAHGTEGHQDLGRARVAGDRPQLGSAGTDTARKGLCLEQF